MKKFSKIVIFVFLSAFMLAGCNGLLDVDSNRQVFEDEYKLTAANDTLYSMFGVFSQLEKIADSYILLGELRGDLMDVTDKSDLYLKEINNFNNSSKNPYTNNIKDYYSVINNCNYIIHNIDTSVVKGTKKVLLKEYAACKAIRAWTFMQIALNYGSVIYYDKPITTVKDAETVQQQQPISLNELAPILIADLKPYENIEKPNFGSLFSFNTTYSFFPIKFILGDLYLWSGLYLEAATEYHSLMYDKKYIISSAYRSTYSIINNAFTSSSSGWDFISLTSERITNIAATNQYTPCFTLDSLVLNRYVIPSDISINNWDKQMYYYTNTLDTLGDLRKITSVTNILDDNRVSLNVTTKTNNYIYKYVSMNPILDTKKTSKQVSVYRVPLLYLRYAEAVNQLKKPNLAFAVLKFGLTASTINNKNIIPQNELSSPLPDYMNFDDIKVVTTDGTIYNNIGIRMRGCGNVNNDTTYYRIPALPTRQDSMTYVEDMIEQELALETAYEGNRFQDLMRIAIRRNDNGYLAKKVAAKHKDNQAEITRILSDRSNWYLKK